MNSPNQAINLYVRCCYGYLISHSRLVETGVKAEEWGPVIHRLLSRKQEARHYKCSALIGD